MARPGRLTGMGFVRRRGRCDLSQGLCARLRDGHVRALRLLLAAVSEGDHVQARPRRSARLPDLVPLPAPVRRTLFPPAFPGPCLRASCPSTDAVRLPPPRPPRFAIRPTKGNASSKQPWDCGEDTPDCQGALQMLCARNLTGNAAYDKWCRAPPAREGGDRRHPPRTHRHARRYARLALPCPASASASPPGGASRTAS